LADASTEVHSHRLLIDAIRRRDPEASARVMTEHLDASEDVRRSAADRG
jgi:DNA-binding GntR family transcriptional regulator